MSSQQKAEVVDREATALELAKAGYTFRQIGDHLGMTGSGAFKAFQRAMRKTIQPAADEFRKLQIEQYNQIVKANWRACLTGDPKAAGSVFKAMEGIARLLGLDAPTKINISLIVDQAAAELGLTDDERTALHADLQAFIAGDRVAV